MGFGLLSTFLILSLLIRPLVCQGPNTDEFFVSEFLQKLGLRLNLSKDDSLSGPCCSWKGVICDDSGVNIVKVAFSGLGLSGTIPDNTIGKLVRLENLDLSRNRITGLPNDFWSLGSLKNLNLSHNQISGILPNNIGNFGQLQTLDLSHNILSGKIPETMSSLISLRVLNLGGNSFESAIPLGILQCKSLVSIDLSGNKLNGSVPDGFGAAFPGLEFLNLAGNQISSQDSDFVGMNSIRYFNVSGNLFEGSVAGVFGGPAEVIDLSKNQLKGQVTFDSSKLIYLDASENLFSGVVGGDLSHSVNLKHLNLAHNAFTELRLQRINMASGLEYLNLSETNLMGQILSNVSRLSSLRVLDLSRNNLSGRIPSLFTKKLEFLDLSYNKLTGEIPIVLLGQLQVMEKFNFSYNDLSFCGSQFLNGTLQIGFVGLVNVCPIAANPVLLKRDAPKHRGLKLALALSLSMACLLAGFLFLAFGCRRRNKMWEVKQNSCIEEQMISGPFSFQADSTTWAADVKQATAVPVIVFEKPLLNFTFADLMSATSNFDRGMLLAEGQFGPVYSGVLPGGVHVAIKVLVHGSTMTDREAARELEYLGRVKHPNLVPLIGYCLAGDQRIAIYDYMENGNLQNLLHDLPLGVQATEDWKADAWEDTGSEGSLASWSFRYKIALGAARALAFLHHGCSPPIIHRDVKASSVYLDYNLEPKLSDFGLAKIFGNELEDEIARGSPGYTPPEYLQSGGSSPAAATPKSDVYGYGVILFELITGKKPVEDDYPGERVSNLVRWARELVRSNRGSEAIDLKIMGTGPEKKMVEALKIGYLCTAEIPSKRPSMHQVVGLLKDLEPIMQH